MDTKKAPGGAGVGGWPGARPGSARFLPCGGVRSPPGARFEPIGDGPGLFPGIGAVMGGECLDPGHHIPGVSLAGGDFHADSVSSHGVNK